MNDFLRVHHPLSLHHLTALDASPAELIGIAGALGCTHVTLFTHVPEAARHVYPMVTAEAVAELRAALDRSGVTLCNLEVFPLDSDDLSVAGSLGRMADSAFTKRPFLDGTRSCFQAKWHSVRPPVSVMP